MFRRVAPRIASSWSVVTGVYARPSYLASTRFRKDVKRNLERRVATSVEVHHTRCEKQPSIFDKIHFNLKMSCNVKLTLFVILCFAFCARTFYLFTVYPASCARPLHCIASCSDSFCPLMCESSQRKD